MKFAPRNIIMAICLLICFTVPQAAFAASDTVKPTISGTANKTIYIGTSFNPKTGVTAKDNADGTITNKIKISGNVNTKKAGNYKLTYSVSDKAGNKTTVTRTITVKEKTTTASTYISVEANGSIQPGIYKLTNTKLELVVKGDVYKLKEDKGSWVTGEKVSYKNSKGFDWSYITTQYDNPVQVGNTIYFTKYLKDTVYHGHMCGGLETQYNLYKLSNGKVSKVNSDILSNGQGNPLYAHDGALYYLQGKEFGPYNIVKLTPDNKKTIILKEVGDFWIANSKVYYQKGENIYNYDLKTKKSTAIKTNSDSLYSSYVCGPADYTKLPNGLVYYVDDANYNSTYYFYEYSTGKSTKYIQADEIYMYDILDISPSKKLVLAYNFDANKYVLYNLNGEKTKTLNIPANAQLLSTSLEKRKVTYLSGTQVKELTF